MQFHPQGFEIRDGGGLGGQWGEGILEKIGFLGGRPEFLDLAIVYGFLNVIGVIAVLKFFRRGSLGDPGEEEAG